MGVVEFDFGLCADSSFDADGHPELGLDHYGPVGQASGAKGAHVHPFGFDSRPLDPVATSDGTPTNGCSMLVMHDGDRMNMMPLEDPRVVAKLPKQRKGGSRQYCAAGNFAMFEGEDPAGNDLAGGYTIGVKYAGGKKSHVLSMAIRTDGKEECSFKHGEGHGFVATAGGKRSAILRNAAGDGYFETNDKGNVINGTTKVNGGMSVGGASAIPVALAKPLIALLGEILTLMATTPGVAPGAPLIPAAAALAGQLASIESQMMSAV